MRDARLKHPDQHLVTFKSDIAGAFLTLPAHPIWQPRQVVRVDDIMRLVRCQILGCRGSPKLWCAFSGLLCWVATKKLENDGLHVYMDDFFGWDFATNLVRYYGKRRPIKQVYMIILWERLGVPLDDAKKDHGEMLKIICFWTAVNDGTISITSEPINHLLEHIDSFISTTSRRQTLISWQRLLGYLKWSLNVFPWGRPALSALYNKISGKKVGDADIYLNVDVRESLSWFTTTLPKAIGISFVDDGHWSNHEADMVYWTDASFDGISFTFAGHGFAYPLSQRNTSSSKIDIFFLEMMGILSALYHAATLPSPPKRVLIHTDSMDSVQAFDRLRTSQASHTSILLAVADIITKTGIDLRVVHIAGKLNIAADLLSRLLIEEFLRLFPSYRVRMFEPPRQLLPARWRSLF